MTRREMREHCFKMLFCADFYPAEEIALQIERYYQSVEEESESPEGVTEILHRVELNEEDEKLLTDRVETMLLKVKDIDATINAISEGWKTRRMGKVELTILRQAIFEMRYDDHIPEKVAINEAVDLAKKFGGTDSAAFINGVLAKLATAG